MSTETLQEAGVVPDVLTSIPTPEVDLGLKVSFENETIQMGSTMPRQETTTKTPTLQVGGASEASQGAKYTIICTDPDLFKKNDPTGQVRHWLQTGLTINSDGVLTSSEPPITPYLPCAPGPGPAHRYVFILCQEAPDSTISTLASQEFESKSGTHDLKERMGFYAQPFIDKYDLKIVGVTFMKVGPNASALVDNMKLGMQSIGHKILGK